MTYKIETGIPIPEDGRRKTGASAAIRSLNVGDSFFVHGKAMHSISVFVSRVKKSTGRKFTSRVLDGGVRIWRIE